MLLHQIFIIISIASLLCLNGVISLPYLLVYKSRSVLHIQQTQYTIYNLQYTQEGRKRNTSIFFITKIEQKRTHYILFKYHSSLKQGRHPANSYEKFREFSWIYSNCLKFTRVCAFWETRDKRTDRRTDGPTAKASYRVLFATKKETPKNSNAARENLTKIRNKDPLRRCRYGHKILQAHFSSHVMTLHGKWFSYKERKVPGNKIYGHISYLNQ